MVTMETTLVNEYGEEVTVKVTYDGREITCSITANARPMPDILTPKVRAAIRELMSPANFEPAYKDQTPM